MPPHSETSYPLSFPQECCLFLPFFTASLSLSPLLHSLASTLLKLGAWPLASHTISSQRLLQAPLAASPLVSSYLISWQHLAIQPEAVSSSIDPPTVSISALLAASIQIPLASCHWRLTLKSAETLCFIYRLSFAFSAGFKRLMIPRIVAPVSTPLFTSPYKSFPFHCVITSNLANRDLQRSYFLPPSPIYMYVCAACLCMHVSSACV